MVGKKTNDQTESLNEKSLAAQSLESLETQWKALSLEIQNYPAPITGCDESFNHLLERQRTLREALRQKRLLKQAF